MSYEDSLRKAKELLLVEINELKDQLAHKEQNLKKLDSFLKEPQGHNNRCSLTKNIVEIVYRLVTHERQPVTAKAVVKEFYRHRNDVNESTIRSTLYQVSKKQKPTNVDVDNQKIAVTVLKEGPTYDIVIANNGTVIKQAQA